MQFQYSVFILLTSSDRDKQIAKCRCKSWNQQVSLGTEDTFSVSFPEQCAGVMVAV